MENKKTVVFGASPDSYRYSYQAVKRLRENDHEVVALGIHPGHIKDVEITTDKPEIDNVHTVTMYMRPEIQKPLYDYIFSLKPERIIFNPGTENRELEKLAEEKGIETMEACTLVLLSIGGY